MADRKPYLPWQPERSTPSWFLFIRTQCEWRLSKLPARRLHLVFSQTLAFGVRRETLLVARLLVSTGVWHHGHFRIVRCFVLSPIRVVVSHSFHLPWVTLEVWVLTRWPSCCCHEDGGRREVEDQVALVLFSQHRSRNVHVNKDFLSYSWLVDVRPGSLRFNILDRSTSSSSGSAGTCCH